MADVKWFNAVKGVFETWLDMLDGTWARIVAAIGIANVFSCEIIRPADTTQYATSDVIGVNVAIVGITAQAVTGLCLVQVAASVIDTILLDKDYITIASATGTTEANGDYTMTKVDATHFTIPVTFVNAWISGGTIAKMAQVDIARVNGGSGYINWLRLVTNNTSTTNAQFDIYVYFSLLSAILDNGQQTVLYANASKGIFLGSFVMSSGGTGSDSVRSDILNVNTLFKCATGSKRLYFRLVNTSATGYTPASAQKFSLTIGADLN